MDWSLQVLLAVDDSIDDLILNMAFRKVVANVILRPIDSQV